MNLDAAFHDEGLQSTADFLGDVIHQMESVTRFDLSFVDAPHDSIIGEFETTIRQQSELHLPETFCGSVEFPEFRIRVSFLRCDAIPLRVQHAFDSCGNPVEWAAYLEPGITQHEDGSWRATYLVRQWDRGGW